LGLYGDIFVVVFFNRAALLRIHICVQYKGPTMEGC